jgi:excisionase family DNA binding protein
MTAKTDPFAALVDAIAEAVAAKLEKRLGAMVRADYEKEPTAALVKAATQLRVTVPEAAKILGVSRSRLYCHVKAGNLKAVKDGGRTLFLVSELRAFIDRRPR